MTEASCPLCQPQNEIILWQEDLLRVIRVGDPNYPGFCRVILNRHVKEMTDLDLEERTRLMQTVFGVEAALRARLQPDKINLAALGNQVPHLHWHVIPRFVDDAHFPDPIWAAVRRVGRPHPVNEAQLKQSIASHLAAI